jgi:nicotinamidase-related amidase
MHTPQLSIDKSRTALVFIEFQNEWLNTEGVLFNRLIQDKQEIFSAVRHADAILQAAREQGWHVVHAGLDFTHDSTYRLFAGGQGVMGLRAAIPQAQTWVGDASAFVPPFVPKHGEFVTRGRSGASVLKNSNLDAFLRNNRIDTLVLCGFATHICVESSMREAHDMGLNVYVAEQACAAFNRAQHDYFLEHIVHHFGAAIATDALLMQINAREPACSF